MRKQEEEEVTMIVERKQARIVRPELSDGTRNFPKAVALAATDLIMPMVHVEILFAFRAPTPPVQKLEDGLAKVLCEYREWAGRIRCDEKGWASTIELSDEGVQCVEATADCSVEELMPFHPTQRLHDLVPEVGGVKDPLLVQMTKFRCGGMTLGIAWNHRVADGQAFIYFMQEWTRCVKGLPPTCSLSHDRSQLMAIGTATGHLQQIREIEPTIPTSSPSVSKSRLHFTPDMLLKIKEKSTIQLTTFAAITGHLWRCISKARRLDPEVVTCVAISIDGRQRLSPPLPESYFGNVVFAPLTISTANDLLNNPASYPASLIQTSLAQANDQYLRESLLHIQKTVESLDQNSNLPTAAYPNLVVTSWLRFPLYEMDFGWGAPAFVGNVPRGEEGLLLLLPSHTRDGSIDAVVQLFSADLQKLEELCYNI